MPAVGLGTEHSRLSAIRPPSQLPPADWNLGPRGLRPRPCRGFALEVSRISPCSPRNWRMTEARRRRLRSEDGGGRKDAKGED